MTIKELVQTYVAYNRQVYHDLENLVNSQISSRWTVPTGSYFVNLKGILNHLTISDVVWLKRFYENNFCSKELKDLVSTLPEAKYGQELVKTWEEYQALRPKLDEGWQIVAESLPEDRLDELFTYTTVQGKSITLPWVGVIFHLLNHQTHHRGAISQILDSWGIDNDYSGMNKFFIHP